MPSASDDALSVPRTIRMILCYDGQYHWTQCQSLYFNDNFTYNLMFMSPSQGRKRKLRIIFLLSVVAIVTRWKRGENILFLHMASKCDIISRLFKKCKIKCVNLLEKHQYLGTSMLHKLSLDQKNRLTNLW